MGKYAVASAPGKVILFGEHFVVRGSKSIASAISLRVRVRVERASGDRISVYSERAGVRGDYIGLPDLRASSAKLEPLLGLLGYLREKHGLNPYPARISVESDLPIGAGLGSSAAFAVAFALAYSKLGGLDLTREELVEAGYASERIAHGRPSGIDNTIAVYGGGLLYKRGEKPRRIRIRLPKGFVLVVADSGIPRSTRTVVERVLDRADRLGSISSLIYRAADELADLALEALERGDAGLLGELMDVNQGLLYAMGASSAGLESLLYAARHAGAIGAKLTGAGWGGSVIALAPAASSERVVRALLRAGAREARVVDLGGAGAMLEDCVL